MKKQAENNVNYQERALEFKVGDVVIPYGLLDSQAGRVTAVWPGIGMIDVEAALGSKRYPVEGVTKMNQSTSSDPPYTDSVVGGSREASVAKVAMYWADKDRKYKLTKNELESKTIYCYRCLGTPLKKATYVRDGGVSDHLLGCPSCMFLIRFEDILNHWKWDTV